MQFDDPITGKAEKLAKTMPSDMLLLMTQYMAYNARIADQRGDKILGAALLGDAIIFQNELKQNRHDEVLAMMN